MRAKDKQIDTVLSNSFLRSEQQELSPILCPPWHGNFVEPLASQLLRSDARHAAARSLV